MKKKSAKTRGPTEKELREFASWCANYGEGLKDEVIDFERLGKCAKNKAQELFRPKCVECGK